MRRVPAVLAIAVTTAASAAVLTPVPAAAADPTVAGTYVAVTPYRAADTHTGVNGNRKGRLAAGTSSRVSLAGHVPSSASAAVVSVSAVGASTNGFLTLYRDGAAVPSTWTELYRAGVTTTVTTIVPLADARFLVRNGAGTGSTDFVVDVRGYYVGGSVPDRPGLTRVPSPVRVVSSSTTIAAGRSVTKHVGPTGIKSTASLMLHVLSPARPGSISVYPADTPAPALGSVYYPAGYGFSGLVQARLDTDGNAVFTNRGSTAVRIAVDQLGYSVRYAPLDAGAQETLTPQRVYSGTSVAAHGTARLTLAGKGGVPLSGAGTALVALTVGSTASSGGIVAGAAGSTGTATRTLSFRTGETIGALAYAATAGGQIDVVNDSGGSLRLYVDVVGYFPTTTIAPPAAFPSRYPNTLTGATTDLATMTAHGCTDGTAKPSFVLLDIGAQSISSPLSADNPGVALALTGTDAVHLTYPQLVQRVQAYLTGFAQCAGGSAATVAVGTNNDGVWTPGKSDYYSPAARGADWADDVIEPIAASAPSSISVVGADDIESSFASDQYQAAAWEDAYLAATTGDLIYNGSADECPTTYGATTACAYGWTLAQYAHLASNSGRVEVLPQIYNRDQAVQWANVDQASGGSLVYVGALLQTISGGFTPAQSWAALWRALSAVRATVPSFASVHIEPDSG